MTNELTKVCPKCGRELPLSEFYKDKSNKDGLRTYCKECHKEYAKSYDKCIKNLSCPRVGMRGAVFETFTCEICGKEFRQLKSKVDYNYEHNGFLPKYCSRECWGIAHRGNRTIERIFEKWANLDN